jgi:hypothetical protein
MPHVMTIFSDKGIRAALTDLVESNGNTEHSVGINKLVPATQQQ